MARTCTVCGHPESFEINEAMVLEGRSTRNIAKQYGVDHSSIQRHKAHIPELLLKAKEDLEGYEAGSILRRIEDLEKETLAQLEALKEGDDPDRRTILLAIREQRSNIELVAKIHQLIDQAPQINVTLSPEWLELRAVLVTALEPYSDARGAVLKAIEGVGNGRA